MHLVAPSRIERAVTTVAIGLLVAFVAACSGEPEPTVAAAPTPPGQASSAGRILYLSYCESCHGVEGRGDGRAAGYLDDPPADLTRLSERYGTPLDRERLAKYIDGREMVALHGLREMPVWGEEFFGDAPPESPNLEQLRHRVIDLLIDHLETLQAKRQASAPGGGRPLARTGG